jgi:hypothetical protein
MSTRDTLLASIAHTIGDYRVSEVSQPTPAHVDRWVRQFEEDSQRAILREMDRALESTYIPRGEMTGFLAQVSHASEPSGADAARFWRRANLLDIQLGGNSQRELLTMFATTLRSEHGLEAASCGSEGGSYVYLDDALFTGNRLIRDVTRWLSALSVRRATLTIVVYASHQQGEEYANRMIERAAVRAGVDLTVTWWRRKSLENRDICVDDADVLRPRSLGDDPSVQAYASGLRHRPILRRSAGVGGAGVFSSPHNRDVLENAFLTAGVRIRSRYPQRMSYLRPLGYSKLDNLGFGSLLVTFLNCPNTAPLTLWASDPWYSLFPRRTNR